MYFKLVDGALRKADPTDEPGAPLLGLCTMAELPEAATRHAFPVRLIQGLETCRATRYEALSGCGAITLLLPDTWDDCTGEERVIILLRKNVLLFFCTELFAVSASLRRAVEDDDPDGSLSRLLHDFFSEQMERDSNYLEAVEQQLTVLEDALLTGERRDCVEDIIGLRRRLMALSCHYDDFLDVLEALEEDSGEFLSGASARSLHSLVNRADRVHNRLRALRDTVTQVREAYQAQMDISLANTMKLFTIVTSIFLPLTLIVGWYGMNLQMPEFEWRYGYLFVAALAVGVVTAFFVYLKKKKLL